LFYELPLGLDARLVVLVPDQVNEMQRNYEHYLAVAGQMTGRNPWHE
jgi:hypothetical protein